MKLQVEPLPDESVLSFWQRATSHLDVPILKRLVRYCLTIPHGNSDVERLFSMLSDIITKKRNSLDQQSIRALTFTKSHLQSRNMACFEVPLSEELRQMAQNANSAYKQRKNEEKMKLAEAERELTRKKIEEELQKERQQSTKLKKLEFDLASVEEKQKEATARKRKAEEMEQEARNLREAAAIEEENQLNRKMKIIEKQARVERQIVNRITTKKNLPPF